MSGDEGVLQRGGGGDVDVRYSRVTCFIIYICIYTCTIIIIIIILVCALAYKSVCRAAAQFDVVCNPRGVQYYTRGYATACVDIVNRRRDGLEGFY